MSRTAESKIYSYASLVEHLRFQPHNIVFTDGTFDLFHIGHLYHLQWSKQVRPDSILVVSVAHDDNVRAAKGLGRPIIPQPHRVKIVAAIECVDYVWQAEAEHPTPIQLFNAISGITYTHGKEARMPGMPLQELVSHGGTYVYDGTYLASTSEVIDRVRRRCPR